MRADKSRAMVAVVLGVVALVAGVVDVDGRGDGANWFLIVAGAAGLLYGAVVLVLAAVRRE